MSEVSRIALIALVAGLLLWGVSHSWVTSVRWVSAQSRALPNWERCVWWVVVRLFGPIGRFAFLLTYDTPDDHTTSEQTDFSVTDMTWDARGDDELTQAPISSYSLRVVSAPNGTGQQFALADGVTVIGRNPSTRRSTHVVSLNGDKAISREHATIELQADGTLMATDLHSSYGTRINGARLTPDTPAPLHETDTLQLGNTSLTLDKGEGSSRLRIDITPRYQLRVMRGPDRGKQLRLDGRRWTVGRSDSADWRLSDPKLSRKHAEIRLEGSIVRVVDLGSRHGVTINRRPQQNGALGSGDLLMLGDNEIELEELT